MTKLKKKKWNYYFNLYNALLLHKFPVSLTHFVTERCNASCPHCFVDLNKTKNELTLEQIEKIASSSGNALRNVSLTGGEPFLRNDFCEIAEIWYKNSTVQSLAICTNGSFPEKIENFVKKANKENLPVSFFFSYDYIGEKHSEYRKINDLHLKVVESYNIVHKYFPKMNATFNLTVTKDNFNSAIETYNYIKNVLKIQNINCTLVRGKSTEDINIETKNQIANVYEKIQKELDDDFDNGEIAGYYDKSLTSTLLNAKNKMLWKYILKTFKENKYISPCCAGSLFGVISSCGEVFPCELLQTEPLYLKEYDYNFMNCYNSDTMKKIRENIISSKCFCTFECSWLLNIFSSPRYYPELINHILKNSNRKIKQ